MSVTSTPASARRQGSTPGALGELADLFTRHRQLTMDLARREVSDRYLGQLGGAFWALGHPLVLVGVYLFVFTVVFKIRLSGPTESPLGYTAYLLSGLIPWLGIQETLSKASTVMLGNANLVKQVVFPVEVLPVKSALAALITQAVFVALLAVYVVLKLGSLPWTLVLVPLLMALQALMMFGAAYAVAAVSPYFRDIKDLVQVFGVIGVYLIPAFFLPESVPALFRPALWANPFSYLVWCYQDVFFFGRIAHPWAWVVLVVLSLVGFYGGYRLFRLLKPMFGNVL